MSRKQRHPMKSVNRWDPDFKGVTIHMQTQLNKDSADQGRLLITSQYRRTGDAAGPTPALRTHSAQEVQVPETAILYLLQETTKLVPPVKTEMLESSIDGSALQNAPNSPKRTEGRDPPAPPRLSCPSDKASDAVTGVRPSAYSGSFKFLPSLEGCSSLDVMSLISVQCKRLMNPESLLEPALPSTAAFGRVRGAERETSREVGSECPEVLTNDAKKEAGAGGLQGGPKKVAPYDPKDGCNTSSAEGFVFVPLRVVEEKRTEGNGTPALGEIVQVYGEDPKQCKTEGSSFQSLAFRTPGCPRKVKTTSDLLADTSLNSSSGPFCATEGCFGKEDRPASMLKLERGKNSAVGCHRNFARLSMDNTSVSQTGVSYRKMDSNSNELQQDEPDPFENRNNNKCCASCNTKKTPLWRDAEDGTPLCNACGIRSWSSLRSGSEEVWISRGPEFSRNTVGVRPRMGFVSWSPEIHLLRVA
ncbi:GATA-type zinc finger protein 1 [Acipenser ruthenus]|uniref:GATA-type zinc finger protein 1 n=1 Tax=Acipenser ruthenus TaxID=7906 RepID=A0A444UZZ6_ACIRT|nr:GATA-type zinc finger protein 1 [Acipenser ruthenus]